MNQHGKVISPPKKLTASFLFKSSLRHQSMFIKRQLFESVFYYNESLKIVSDWEFIICAILKYGATYKHIDFIVSIYEGNGISQIEENLELHLKEKRGCLNNHFGPFMEDYNELDRLQKFASLKRYKILAELENSLWGRRINTLILRVQLFIFRGKNLSDLE